VSSSSSSHRHRHPNRGALVIALTPPLPRSPAFSFSHSTAGTPHYRTTVPHYLLSALLGLLGEHASVPRGRSNGQPAHAQLATQHTPTSCGFARPTGRPSVLVPLWPTNGPRPVHWDSCTFAVCGLWLGLAWLGLAWLGLAWFCSPLNVR
jgi:hypothetical protein